MEEAIQLLDANTALVNRTETVAKFIATKAVEISQKELHKSQKEVLECHKEILSLQSQIIRIQSLAIEFADWLHSNCDITLERPSEGDGKWCFNHIWLNTNECYEIFLSERG